MSTQDRTFNFPFISNLMNGKSVSQSEPYRKNLAAKKEKALCLDDDPLSLRLVEHLIKQRYEVITCATLDSAIKAVKKHTIQLFLCDYHLSERLTGAEAHAILTQKYGFNPRTQVLITSYPSPEIEREMLSIGFDCVFAKPLRREFQSYCMNLWSPPFKQSAVIG